MRSRRKNLPSALVLRNEHGILSTVPQLVAENFRDYFSTICASNVSNIPPFESRNFCVPLTDIEFNEEAVLSIMRRTNVYSAMGTDEAHPRILKEASEQLKHTVTTYFEKSLSDNTVPSLWKEAIVTPIYKNGDRHSPKSYRPISLTCIISKWMEKLVKKAIMDHLGENNLLSPNQHGFVHKGPASLTYYSSQTALLTLTTAD